MDENYIVNGYDLSAIADAIRSKTGSSVGLQVGEMSNAILSISTGGGGDVESIEWHQCPELVRNYIANVTYAPSDYTTSQIANYAPSTPSVSNYRPVGKTIDAVTYCNQIPNIKIPFASANVAGTLKSLDTLRWIKSSYASNVRDIGGWACDGGTIKYGLLYRGGEIVASDRGVLVDECGIRHELNLRGTAEANRSVSPLGSDIRFCCPTNFVWYSLEDTATWKQILLYVIEAVTHNEPVYFHCSAGADRTGTVACLLEALLGVSQSDIDKDYELTCFATGTDTDAHARRRNETDWKNLITAINSNSGDSFRDKAVSFAVSCGIPVSRINDFRAAMSTGTPDVLIGETRAITSILSHATLGNADTTIEYQASYTTAVNADSGYQIASVAIVMGGADISSCYSNGVITIPNVTGDVIITVATTVIVYNDFEVYNSSNVLLNKAYSGTNIVDKNGAYITGEVPLDLNKYRYLKVNGAHMSGYTAGTNNPVIYKVVFCKDGSTYAVKYSNSIATSTDASKTSWVIDMSLYNNYSQCDSIRLQIEVGTSTITSANVLTSNQLSVIASTQLETAATHTIVNKLTNVTTNNSATSVNDMSSYTATLSASSGYVIKTVTITMGGVDISSCYAGGKITIENVTGDVVITATAGVLALEDVELYNPTNPKLNMKFSGTSMVSSNGSYLVEASIADIDMTKYKYLKVNGAHMSGYGGAISASNPILYKIAYVKNGSIIAVQYSNNQATTTDATSKQFIVDMSANDNNNYQNCDTLIFMVNVASTSTGITSANVLTVEQLQITASTNTGNL